MKLIRKFPKPNETLYIDGKYSYRNFEDKPPEKFHVFSDSINYHYYLTELRIPKGVTGYRRLRTAMLKVFYYWDKKQKVPYKGWKGRYYIRTCESCGGWENRVLEGGQGTMDYFYWDYSDGKNIFGIESDRSEIEIEYLPEEDIWRINSIKLVQHITELGTQITNITDVVEDFLNRIIKMFPNHTSVKKYDYEPSDPNYDGCYITDLRDINFHWYGITWSISGYKRPIAEVFYYNENTLLNCHRKFIEMVEENDDLKYDLTEKYKSSSIISKYKGKYWLSDWSEFERELRKLNQE